MTPEAINLIIGGAISVASICLTSIVTLLAAWIAYYFQKKNDERKREWEIEDKKTNRHVAITDMRIKDAKDFLDIYINIIDNITNLEGSIMGEIAGQPLSALLMNPVKIEDATKSYQQIVKSVNDTKGKRISFLILDNRELNEHLDAFLALVADELVYMGETMNKASKDGFFEDKTEYLENVLFFNQRASAFIQTMHTRLDELAKKVP